MKRQALKPRPLPNLPPSVEPGDRVGVAALSSPVDPAKLEPGLQALAELGYEPVEAANLRARVGLFAGTDQDRLDAFHALVADPSVKAIVFARGGHGLLRLMPSIDWRLLARHPKAYVGYSDLTPFLLQVVSRLGLVAFHGPMVAGDLSRGLDDAERDSLCGALAGRFPTRFALHAPALDGSAELEEAVEGPLLGGCLSMLVATLGTPYAPRLDGALLFLEEVAEPLYRIDRMLTHLELSGRLSKIRGLIVGHLAGCGEESRADSQTEPHLPAVDRARDSCRSVLQGAARRWGCPVVEGLAAGHSVPNLTLPLGLTARLEPGGGCLVVG